MNTRYNHARLVKHVKHTRR